jgi:metal transporter CNNM
MEYTNCSHAIDLPLEEEQEDETTSLLGHHVSGKDGVQALRQTYGSAGPIAATQLPSLEDGTPTLSLDTAEQVDGSTQTSKPSAVDLTSDAPAHRSGGSDDSLHFLRSDTFAPKRSVARSGSITENVIESRGVRKVVLETTSSTDEDDFAITTSPDQSKSQSRTNLSIFIRDQVPEVQEEEEEEGGILSPDPGDESAPGPPKTQSGAGDGGGRKKSRRKKRKGGKS